MTSLRNRKPKDTSSAVPPQSSSAENTNAIATNGEANGVGSKTLEAPAEPLSHAPTPPKVQEVTSAPVPAAPPETGQPSPASEWKEADTLVKVLAMLIHKTFEKSAAVGLTILGMIPVVVLAIVGFCLMMVSHYRADGVLLLKAVGVGVIGAGGGWGIKSGIKAGLKAFSKRSKTKKSSKAKKNGKGGADAEDSSG